MFKIHKKTKKGFTLIELLVVVAIISLLSSVVLASLNSARAKARDAKRKQTLTQLRIANELAFSNSPTGIYTDTTGWIEVPTDGVLTPALVTPGYISSLVSETSTYQYWRKNYTEYACMTLNDSNKYGFYVKLENPSASDPNFISSTVGDSFDRCVASTWSMNYRIGN